MRHYRLEYEHLGGGYDLAGVYETKTELLSEAEPGAVITSWECSTAVRYDDLTANWAKTATEEIPWDGVDRRWNTLVVYVPCCGNDDCPDCSGRGWKPPGGAAS